MLSKQKGNEVVMCIASGILLIPAAGKILIKKSWQHKHCKLFKASKFGVQRLEIYENTDTTKQVPLRIITLQDCIKVTPKSPTYFTITAKSGLHEFGALTTTALNEWLTALQSVAFPDDSSKLSSIQEDNDLYCPSGEGIFCVKLHPSTASLRCGLEEKSYLLVLTNHAAQLRNCHDNKVLFTWPYRFIRRYGYKNGKFTFEAGRKCESGEGIFFLEHSDQQEIFRCFAAKIKTMKKLLSNESVSSMLEIDNSFHAALSMEPGSRSPLPLSLPSSTSKHDIEQSIPVFPQPSHFEINNALAKSIIKPRPAKPPRKNLNIKDDKPIYEAVNKYDEIEYRNNAWKTMGVNDFDHVESEDSQSEEYVSWGEIKRVRNILPQVTQAPKVISEPQNLEDYDKLNFFGTTKVGNKPSTYKDVKINSNDFFSNPPSFNDYDEVEIDTIRNCVVSSDEKNSKDFFSSKETPKRIEGYQVSHQLCNDEPYAIRLQYENPSQDAFIYYYYKPLCKSLYYILYI
ncbi:hypothetical protein HHI36_016432 [Cryptolaemus montrouzieri]|uniref:Insulin receptor substrate 1 n=1 Tax=Cryptolaemus montrouzieri TaxID=559131 RepID=A0ABD2NK41_9CUCU